MSESSHQQPDTLYEYDAFGDLCATAIDVDGDGQISHAGPDRITATHETYEQDASNVWWRVTSRADSAGGVTNALTVTREQLTGLSPALLSRTVTVAPDGTTTTVTRAFEPGTDIIAETSRTGAASPRIRRTLHGRELECAGPESGTLLAYDGFGRAVSRTVTNAAGTVSTTAVVYDTFGNAVTNETTYGSLTAVTATGYDSQGRAVSQTDALGNAVATAYDRAGNVTAQWGATHPVAYEYDTQGRRIAMATTRDDTFDFASVTNSSILNPNSSLDVTQWRYDAATGLLTNKVYADGSRIVYTHTSDGKPLRTTWARGAWKENAYDALGQLTTIAYGGKVPKVYHAYDVFGYVVASSNAVASYEYANSLSGVATNETITINGDTVTLTRELGERHHLSALHVGNAPVHYGYDAENRLAVASNDVFTVAYALTADGWDAGYAVTLANGLTVTRAVTRDPHRRHLIGTITNAVNGTMANALSFGHDLLGRITNRNADTFGYNTRSEVTGAVIDTDLFNYSYDSIGNNCWVSVNAVTNTYTANALNQYTAAGSVSPVYDADGNMRWDGRMWHTWDAENRLVRSEPGWDGSTNGARRVVNRYDHMSRLVETRVEMLSGRGAGYPFDPSQGGTWDTVETRTFVYDGWLPVLEKITRTNDATEIREHVWGKDLSGTRGGAGGVGGLLATRVGGAWYFPLYDNNGNVTDYIDASGAAVAHREYGSFGETSAASGPMADAFSFWFSTKYLHHETGLYYYGYRFYSPEFLRWLNRDPVWENGGLNLYVIAKNNPVSNVDPLGREVYEGELFRLIVDSEPLYLDDADFDRINPARNVIGLFYPDPSKRGNVDGNGKFWDWSGANCHDRTDGRTTGLLVTEKATEYYIKKIRRWAKGYPYPVSGTIEQHENTHYQNTIAFWLAYESEVRSFQNQCVCPKCTGPIDSYLGYRYSALSWQTFIKQNALDTADYHRINLSTFAIEPALREEQKAAQIREKHADCFRGL